MSALFYIGILLALLSIIPWLLLNGKMARDTKEYEKMPFKMRELKASYRQKRFYLMLFQMAAIIIAIVGIIH